MNDASAILVDENGFSLPGTEGKQILWSSVWRIRALKLDLMTWDEVVLCFETDGVPEYVEVSEEEPRFEEFRVFVEKRFSFRDGWWAAVLQLPFARNEEVLYVRANDAQSPAPGESGPGPRTTGTGDP